MLHPNTMASVAKRTRIVPDTIRAWERRYKLVVPRREASGVRVYSDEDVVRLELARDATRLGHPIRYVAQMSNREIEALLQASPRATVQHSAGGEAVVASAMTYMQRYDFIAVQRALVDAALSLPRETFALAVLAPFLRQIGNAWEMGTLGVAQEHAASQIVRNLVGTLILQSPTTTGASVVFATPPGEQHEFGVAIGALLAAGCGLTATPLGTSLPAKELAALAVRLDARTVVVGSMAGSEDRELPLFLEDLERFLKGRAQVVLGGPAARALCLERPNVQAIPTLEELAAYFRALPVE